MRRRISFAMLLFSVSLLTVLAAGSPLRADDPPGGGNDGPQTGGKVLSRTWYVDVESAGNSSGLGHALDDSIIIANGTLHSMLIKSDPDRDLTYRLSKTVELGYEYEFTINNVKKTIWNSAEQFTASGTITVSKSKEDKEDFYTVKFESRFKPQNLLRVGTTYIARELVFKLERANMTTWKDLTFPKRSTASFVVIDPFKK